jgi:hypothetical protein
MSFYRQPQQRSMYGDENADPSFHRGHHSASYSAGSALAAQRMQGMDEAKAATARIAKQHSARSRMQQHPPPPPPRGGGRALMETPRTNNGHAMAPAPAFESVRHPYPQPDIREEDENDAPTDSDQSLMSVSGDEMGAPGARGTVRR